MGKQGDKKSGGRLKGTPNKRTLDLMAILEEKGYSPVAELIEVGALARLEYERSAEIFDAIQDKRADYDMVPLNESTAPTYLKIMQSSAAELMQYAYPKRKAVELSAPGGGDLFQSFVDLVKQSADAKK